ncbi:MAG: hypothetical protein CMQ19_05890 [Gammaproteobacteria bacterium]|nr:hypothetical protein [Gammaproteobacteria bacterium]
MAALAASIPASSKDSREYSRVQETELFLPIKAYFESHGYSVNAEVKDCDVTATRDDDLIIIELKTSANMSLLIQATERQKISESVYVAIPIAKGNRKHWRGIQRVIRRLELGLLVVSFGPLGATVTKLFDPAPAQRRKSKAKRRTVIREIVDRSAEYNTGGSTQTKLVTAYRENAILIATCLEQLGTCSPKRLRDLGTGDRTPTILAKNHYGWFQRVERGIYSITGQGIEDIKSYTELHNRSQKFLDDQLKNLDTRQ